MKMIVTSSALESTGKTLFPIPLLFDNSSAGNVMRMEMMIAANPANSNSSFSILVMSTSFTVSGAARITIDVMSTATTVLEYGIGIIKSQYRMDLADSTPSYIAHFGQYDPESTNVDLNPVIFGDSKIYFASMEVLR